MSDPNVTVSLRARIGHCPDCGVVITVTNNGQSWPLIECLLCGWEGATDSLANSVRLDTPFLVSDGRGPERERRQPPLLGPAH